MNHKNNDNIIAADAGKAGCRSGRLMKMAGIIMLIISFIFWGFTFFVAPVLPIDIKYRIIAAGISYCIRVALFYTSIYILGREYVHELMKRFLPVKPPS